MYIMMSSCVPACQADANSYEMQMMGSGCRKTMLQRLAQRTTPSWSATGPGCSRSSSPLERVQTSWRPSAPHQVLHDHYREPASLLWLVSSTLWGHGVSTISSDNQAHASSGRKPFLAWFGVIAGVSLGCLRIRGSPTPMQPGALMPFDAVDIHLPRALRGCLLRREPNQRVDAPVDL